MAPRRGCFQKNAVVPAGANKLGVDDEYAHAFAVAMNPSIPGEWPTEDVRPVPKETRPPEQMSQHELGGLMFPDIDIKEEGEKENGMFSTGSVRKMMCRRAIVKSTDAMDKPADGFYKGPDNELGDWKAAREEHPCFLRLTEWPVRGPFPSAWLSPVVTRKRKKGGTSKEELKGRSEQYPSYLLESENGMTLNGMFYFQPCDGDKCFCGGVLALVACGLLHENDLVSTQWKSLVNVLPSLSELWKEIKATTFPVDGRCDKGKELLVLFDRCFLQLYSTIYTQHYVILGLDYQAYHHSDGCSPGPMPLCRNALMEWFPDSM